MSDTVAVLVNGVALAVGGGGVGYTLAVVTGTVTRIAADLDRLRDAPTRETLEPVDRYPGRHRGRATVVAQPVRR